MLYQDDTIVAIATPIGIGGLSVIRVSGKTAIETVDKIFFGKNKIKEAKTQTAHFGIIISPDGNHIDEVIALIFREPNSYTAENMVEVSCHGGIYVTKLVLNSLLQSGARLALPGEFTKRAFLNGRIDLAQAEAVADIIQSSSERAHSASMAQLEGMISNEIKHCQDKLLNICSLLELELDFAEEDLIFHTKTQLKNDISRIFKTINKLIDSYLIGKVYREGIRVAIVGKPNVGKSSILNILLNENRAIVTNIPGTTRDVIEENLIIEGILFKIIDTAGVRETTDLVENEGVARTKAQIEIADLILVILDHTQGFTGEDEEIIRQIGINKNQDILVIINKMDIPANEVKFEETMIKINNPQVHISAKSGKGLPKLKNYMVNIATHGNISKPRDGILVTNLRHKESLIKARNSIQEAIASIDKNLSNEFIAIDCRVAMDHLGEILGEVTTDDLLNNIFSKFCIGK